MTHQDVATASLVAILGLEPALAERLGDTIRQQLGLSCTDNIDTDPEEADWILTTEAAMVEILGRMPADHVGLLWGRRPLTALAQSWIDHGVTLITSLPGDALTWLRAVQEPALSWDEPDASSPLSWDETEEPSLHAAPRRRGTISSVPVTASTPPTTNQSIAVFSSGGGVGKTTTAVYLATVASRLHRTTGLVELDENRRGLLVYWDKQAPKGGLDSIRPGDWANDQALANRLQSVVVPVSSHLSAIAMAGSAEGLQYHQDQAATELGRLYAWSRQTWNLTVYDLPATIRDETVYQTLRAVDRILFVVEPTAIMLESSMAYLNILEELGGEGQEIVGKMGLVVNRIPKMRSARLDPVALADALELPLWGQIPLQPDRYMSAINQHKVSPPPEWTNLWETLDLRPGGDEGRPGVKPSTRTTWQRLLGTNKQKPTLTSRGGRHR